MNNTIVFQINYIFGWKQFPKVEICKKKIGTIKWSYLVFEKHDLI